MSLRRISVLAWPKLILLPVTAFLFLTACGDSDSNSPTEPHSRIDLLANGGIEEGNTEPDNWIAKITGESAFLMERSFEEGNPDNQYLCISGPASPQGSSFSFWEQTINTDIPFNKAVHLKVSIKLVGVDGKGVAVAIRTDDTDPRDDYAEGFITSEGYTEITGNIDWTEYEIALGSVHPETKTITVFLLMLPDTKGTVCFDDVSLTYAE